MTDLQFSEREFGWEAALPKGCVVW